MQSGSVIVRWIFAHLFRSKRVHVRAIAAEIWDTSGRRSHCNTYQRFTNALTQLACLVPDPRAQHRHSSQVEHRPRPSLP